MRVFLPRLLFFVALVGSPIFAAAQPLQVPSQQPDVCYPGCPFCHHAK